MLSTSQAAVAPSLVELVASRVRERTHGRIRSLNVEHVQGRVMVSGHDPSQHAKQLAFYGALELLPGHLFASAITVG